MRSRTKGAIMGATLSALLSVPVCSDIDKSWNSNYCIDTIACENASADQQAIYGSIMLAGGAFIGYVIGGAREDN